MKAMFVKDNYSRPYSKYIVCGAKKLETRNKNMLQELVGERVAVVRTGNRRKTSFTTPYVVGYVDVVSARHCTKKEFDELFYLHLVQPGSYYDSNKNGKWVYELANAEMCVPYPLPKDAIRHGRSWCEFEIPEGEK